MTMISLVCLLALSSVALARPYGGYTSQPMPQVLIRRPVTHTQGYGQIEVQPTQPRLSGYGQIEVQPTQPRFTGYGQTFVSEPRTILPTMPLPPTRADIICRGRLPGTVIVMEDKRGVFSCLDDGKGEEQLCQSGLWYHEGLQRCERTLGPIPNACDSQPCLNGGQCFQDGSHYQCQCAPGFDGTICELDARVCQQQQPCGSALGTRCQSFRAGAALDYICVHQNGLAYGFNAQQVIPSPCTGIDGAVALSITDKGVAYCDGDRMSLESCVEKTHWDDQIKACIWDDETIPGTIPSPVESKTFLSRSSYGELPPPPPKMIESYGEQLPPPPKVNNYGTLPPPPRVNNYGTLPPPPRVNNYGTLPPPPRVNNYGTLPPPPRVNNYGTVPPPPRVNNYGTVPPPPRVNNYGTLPPPPPKVIDTYGERLPPPPPKVIDTYGERLPPPPPKMTESYGEQLPTPPPKMTESYGEQLPPPPPPKVNNYGTFVPPPKVSPPSGY